MILTLKRYITDVRLLFLFNIKMQYGKSMLGSIWVAFKPFMNTITFAIIMSKIAGLPIKDFFGFIAVNLTTWIFISSALSGSARNFADKRGLLVNRPVSLNKITAVFIAKSGYIYLISLILPLTVGFFVGSLKITPELLAIVPYIIIILYIIFCISFIIAAVFPYFEDIAYLIEVGLPIGMWLTPVVYPIEKIPGILAQVQCINPFYILISPFTAIFYRQALPNVAENISLITLAMIVTITYRFVHKKISKDIIYHLAI